MIEELLISTTVEAVSELYDTKLDPDSVQLQITRKEFEGDFTVVVFPIVRFSRKSPEATGEEIGRYLGSHLEEVASFNVIKGFLNLSLSQGFWLDFYNQHATDQGFGFQPKRDIQPVVIEYSAPNTNKPLHLGHIRNNLLGFSIARIMEANGFPVKKVNLVNDRGIHICKSMLAWKKWGNGETPESSGIKGDHLVGKYYVLFDKHYKQQIDEMLTSGLSKEEATRTAPLIEEAQEMLRQWEANDRETRELWHMMNAWVYDGFEHTYRTMGVEFDKVYYESDTYLLGKELVTEGVEKSTLQKEQDGSVWIDLTDDGLDRKLLLRSDGTSVYMTQDLGTAQRRYDEFQPSKLVYVVGNEQEYHFQVLKNVLKHIGRHWFDRIYHLSYGMVELPEGKMKSREGTVVDADDLVQEMFRTAEVTTRELGKVQDFSADEAETLFRIIGLGALKYFILKVDPRKNMLFNPAESIDFNGNTGPFIQYTYARIQSVLRNADMTGMQMITTGRGEFTLFHQERNVLLQLYLFPEVVKDAGTNYNPSLIANYVYDLASFFNRFYHDLSILKEENPEHRMFRIGLCKFTGNVIRSSMWMLGIEVPDRM